MEEEFITRVYRIGDEKQIVNLLDTVFNGWPKFDLQCSKLDHWRWKYIDSPTKTHTTIVTEDNGKIIAVDNSVHKFIKVFDDTVKMGFGADTAIHPDYQGNKIYNKMNEFKKEARSGIQSFWISGNPILIEWAKKRKRAHFSETYRDFLWVDNIDLHIEQRGDSNSRAFLKKGYLTAYKLKNKLNSEKITEKHIIEDIEIFDKRFLDFWNKIKYDYDFIVEKTPNYLNWRYRDTRGGDYIIKVTTLKNSITGYIVLRINKYNRDYNEGYIMELHGLPNYPLVKKQLILNALEYFKENKVNCIHSIAFKTSIEAKLLKQFGFIPHLDDHYIFFSTEHTLNNFEKLVNTPADKINFNYGVTDSI